jgi:hypothetical protein
MYLDGLGLSHQIQTEINRALFRIDCQFRHVADPAEPGVEYSPSGKSERRIFRPAQETLDA